MAYAVVACSKCHVPWLVELRHKRSRCPGCGADADLARRTRLWQGDDAREAQAAVATHRAATAQGVPVEDAAAGTTMQDPLVRHDDPLDAAAAKARTVRNPSARAEQVALWLTRLMGDTDEETLLDAMRRAGIAAARAEKEIVRMLAADVIFEPRAGSYRHLDP